MTEATAATKPPLSFWVVSGLGLLWNAFGAYLYLWAKLNPEKALGGADKAMTDYVTHMPLWAHIGWSLGVWASLLGSLLMLLRSRHATNAFLVSLAGAIASFTAQGMAGVQSLGMAIMICGIIAFLWWFCRNETAKGTLR